MNNPSAKSTWLKLLGIEPGTVSHRERLVSTLGGCLGIFAVYWISRSVSGVDVISRPARMEFMHTILP